MTATVSLAHPFSRALDRATGARPIPGNIVRHIAISSDALDAMIEMIAGAQRTVHFENYIIHDDHTGSRFASAWAERARAGVRGTADGQRRCAKHRAQTKQTLRFHQSPPEGRHQARIAAPT